MIIKIGPAAIRRFKIKRNNLEAGRAILTKTGVIATSDRKPVLTFCIFDC